MSIPNLLSSIRIFSAVPSIILFIYDFYIFSLIVFIFAALTDFFDGYFARLYKEESILGSLLDLIADKVFISSLLIWATFNFNNFILLILTILIISRELSISYLRIHALHIGKTADELNADRGGKIKTTFQMVGIGFLFITPINFNFFIISLLLISLSAFLSWLSFLNYYKKWIV